jgi:hypothetical protein
MNEASLKNLRPFQPGQSGNLSGRPARARLTEQFVSDLSATWAKHGARILEDMARKDGRSFAHLAAKLIPQDVSLSISARLPGDLPPDDWQAMLELLSAVKAALPDDQRKPGDIAALVGEALRLHGAKVVEACAPVANALPNIDKSCDS